MPEERRHVWVYSGKHHVGGIDVRATFDPGVAEMFRQDGGYDVGEYVEASKLKEQEERCERLEEALRRLQMGPDTLTQAGLRIVLDALYPEARTALQHSPGDEG